MSVLKILFSEFLLKINRPKSFKFIKVLKKGDFHSEEFNAKIYPQEKLIKFSIQNAGRKSNFRLNQILEDIRIVCITFVYIDISSRAMSYQGVTMQNVK